VVAASVVVVTGGVVVVVAGGNVVVVATGAVVVGVGASELNDESSVSRVPFDWMRWHTVIVAAVAGVVNVAVAWVHAAAGARFFNQIHEVAPVVARTSATNNVVVVERYQLRNV